MLSGINILGFFKSVADQRWNNADIKEFTAVFKNGTMPSFIIVVDSDGIAGTVELINIIENEVVTSKPIVVTESNGRKILSFTSVQHAGQDDGNYYLKITIDTDIFYSEVFDWCTDISTFVKLSIDSSDITMGGVHVLPYSTTPIVFYLKYNGRSIDVEINEDGSEKFYGDIPAFSAANIIQTLEVNGTAQIFKMLSSLRPFWVNGEIIIEASGYENIIYDTVAEIKESDSFDETIIINFKYRDQDFIASRNEI